VAYVTIVKGHNTERQEPDLVEALPEVDAAKAFELLRIWEPVSLEYYLQGNSFTTDAGAWFGRAPSLTSSNRS
jgi:hypothetical protein